MVGSAWGCVAASAASVASVGAVTVDVGVEAGASCRHKGLIGDDYLGDELAGTSDSFAELVAILFPGAREASGVVLEGHSAPDYLNALVRVVLPADGDA